MTTYVGDTYYYLALLNPADAAHARAREFSLQSAGRIVTSVWVIQELADGLCSPPDRARFLRLLATLEADRYTEIAAADHLLWHRGLDLYRSRADKSWSLTDCISFVIMQDRDIIEALTADHHFEQAGFKALLKPDR